MSNKQEFIPIYLEANNKDELVKAMLENNIKHRKQFQYTTPMKDGSKWVVWYYDDILLNDYLKDFKGSMK